MRVPVSTSAAGSRQEDKKLLAAVTRREVANPEAVANDGPDSGEDVVTARVPEPVVDRLEVVEVTHERSQRRP